MQTVALLTISNVFMTIAWYGHLNFKNSRHLDFSHLERDYPDMISAPIVVYYHDN